MKIFLDTANVEEIKKGVDMGIVDGVTTNPTLVSREGRKLEELIKEICEIVKGPVSVEAVGSTCDEMVEEAKKYSQLSEHVVVKIPMTVEGLKAVKKCRELGIKTNVTLVFSPLQALLAAKAGATYVSPFVGRLDDISHTGMEIVEDIVEIFSNYGFETEVIVASIRHPLHVLHAARIGADIATIPFRVLEQLTKHPLTDIGIERFLKDWEKVPK